MFIVDTNVLIYSVDRHSEHHEAARSWMDATLSGGVETVGIPWLAAVAFLRISTNSRLLPTPLSVEEATGTLRGWFSLPNVVAVDPEASHLDLLAHIATKADIAGDLMNDAHIGAIAMDYGATVVTFDSDFALLGVEILRPRAA